MAREPLFMFFKHLISLLTRAPSMEKKTPSNINGSKPPDEKIHLESINHVSYDHIIGQEEQAPTMTLVFHLEGALLKSPSMFPYFMLVAFGAGGPLRAFLLLLLYPLACLVGHEMGLKMMVFVCFFGVKKRRFRVGEAVLPKHFLEDIGSEGFDVVDMRWAKRVAISDLPNVMVGGLLRDYMGIEGVLGRELVEINGYFLGLMKGRKTDLLEEVLDKSERTGSDVLCFGSSFSKFLDQRTFDHCKVYQVTNSEKKKWQLLPRERYPKPLIFHDGRLAFRPTPSATLALFMWIPLGIFLSSFRIVIGTCGLPFPIFYPMVAFSGFRLVTTGPPDQAPNGSDDKGTVKPKGKLYVCNHRTVFDPISIRLALKNQPLSAVTYSISKFTAVISPIKTVNLTRDREEDRKIINNLLSQGDLVLCPEGTTCREPYLLRFSPLFTEMSEEIVPVAVNVEASMFYGSTASGSKWLDPVFHLGNPRPTAHVRFLGKVSTSCCNGGNGGGGQRSRFEMANSVQHEIARALGFECTSLTRKDKYMILAGNSGNL